MSHSRRLTDRRRIERPSGRLREDGSVLKGDHLQPKRPHEARCAPGRRPGLDATTTTRTLVWRRTGTAIRVLRALRQKHDDALLHDAHPIGADHEEG